MYVPCRMHTRYFYSDISCSVTDGRLEVRKAGKENGASRSMEILLGLIDASPNQDNWEIFYKALKNNGEPMTFLISKLTAIWTLLCVVLIL